VKKRPCRPGSHGRGVRGGGGGSGRRSCRRHRRRQLLRPQLQRRGLPEAINSAPKPREPATTAIGQRLTTYDLVHVRRGLQLHAALYAADTHPHRTPTSGGAGIGSGLNTLSSLPYDEDDFERVRWTSCQVDSGDCLTPKGSRSCGCGWPKAFTSTSTTCTPTPGRRRRRSLSCVEPRAADRVHPVALGGDAVVVMGDTNTRYTRAADTISGFVSDNGLTDAWVKLARGGSAPAPGSRRWCATAERHERLRGRRQGSLPWQQARVAERDLLPQRTREVPRQPGRMLSDHDPVTVRFGWTTQLRAAAVRPVRRAARGLLHRRPAVPAGARVRTVSLRARSASTGSG
jgi:hypothetical protein